MNERECETCIRRKTIYCPNSKQCFATENKPYYQNRIMLLEENQKYKEVINELRDYLKARIEVCDNRLSTPFCNFEKTTKERLILSQCLEKLEELKY